MASADGELPALVLVEQGLDARARAIVIAELSKSKRMRVVPLRALLPAMRSHDRQRRVLERAKALRLRGRQATIALDHPKAAKVLGEARQLLDGSFVRYYDPRRIARIEVLVGVAAMQSVEPDQARDAFVRALHLDPSLTLTAHYSPQVRAAFNSAKSSLPPAPAPTATDLLRVVELADARALLLVRGEAQDGTLLLSTMLLSRREKRALANTSHVIAASGDARDKALAAFITRARERADQLYPAPKTLVKIKNGKKPIVIPPPPTPWYKRWYTWVGLGVGVAAAIIVPLSVRRDTVTGSIALP
ncbi:MAG: hypothetical protein KC503_09745 [Myxococcales bacterium]|nr:hypothetical protein [Myxococcales bacterium]